MNPIRSGRELLAAALLLSLFASPTLADSSIQRIHSTNFGIDQGEIEEIKARRQDAVDGDFLNGALLLVGNGEGVGVLESVGLLSPDNPRPVNSDSIFRIYSMTKPIVSVAIMTMVEEGLMALDDPVSKFIPEFGGARVMDEATGELRPVGNEMTIEHLLTHESGLIQAFFSNVMAIQDYSEAFRKLYFSKTLNTTDIADLARSGEGLTEMEAECVRQFASDLADACGDLDGEVVIADAHFIKYAQEVAEDLMGADDCTWPHTCIDWEQAARDLQFDYVAVTLPAPDAGGIALDFWVQSS